MSAYHAPVHYKVHSRDSLPLPCCALDKDPIRSTLAPTVPFRLDAVQEETWRCSGFAVGYGRHYGFRNWAKMDKMERSPTCFVENLLVARAAVASGGR